MGTISIKEAIDKGIDNWGGEERITNENEIIQILKDPESWTDDLVFLDYSNKPYSIDELIGIKVQVGEETFFVIEDEKTREIMQEIYKIIDPSLKLRETLKELIKKYPNDDELGKSLRRLNLD
jgi:uncharacterized protein involved in tolerance to divalent cations